MPQNHLYRGEVAHKNKAYPGQHEAIVDPDLWRIVQDRLAANRRARSLAVGAEAPSLLAGLIFDSGGDRMTPTHAAKRSKRYRYYISTALIPGSRSEHPKGWRIPAGDIEGSCSIVSDCFSRREPTSPTRSHSLNLDARSLEAALRNSSALSEGWLAMPSLRLRSLV